MVMMLYPKNLKNKLKEKLDHINVICVIKHFAQIHYWKRINEFTQAKDHIYVIYVRKSLQHKVD